jgi:pectin lyase
MTVRKGGEADSCLQTSSLGRQHYSFGQSPSSGITISNSFIDGRTAYSATCDNHTYWDMELVGTADYITFYQNYVYYTSGRSPALSGTTLFHAVNNVWSSNSGHLIEGDTNGMGLYEGNYFLNVPTVVGTFSSGQLFSSYTDLTACSASLGRSCVANAYSGSGSFKYADTSFLTMFKGYSIPSAAAATSIETSVPKAAGNTL